MNDIEKRQLNERKAATDQVMAERHAGFALAAQDNTPKYHRPHFAVVGEGSKSANEAYRKGWEFTFGRKAPSEDEKET